MKKNNPTIEKFVKKMFPFLDNILLVIDAGHVLWVLPQGWPNQDKEIRVDIKHSDLVSHRTKM